MHVLPLLTAGSRQAGFVRFICLQQAVSSHLCFLGAWDCSCAAWTWRPRCCSNFVTCCGWCCCLPLHVEQVLHDGQLLRKGVCCRRMSFEMAADIVREVDDDNDGSVSFAEFEKMWQVPAAY